MNYRPNIVFVVGDEEYRSEESMPMLAKILERDLGAKTTICYSVDSAGFIDPNRLDYIEGLSALKDADMMVLFTRFRALPEDQLKYIIDFSNSGKPMVGFRTATHAFKYPENSPYFYMNNEWPSEVFGQQWITHHGHFSDGNEQMTKVSVIQKERANVVLNGVEDFDAYSWLYHVNGGDWQLHGDCELLLEGTALRSNHKNEGRLDKFPISNPVAWTKHYTGESGKTARVFFTTLGHPYDFKIESMRKLALNGIFWALGKENIIPPKGVNADFIGPYEPNNSGFGQKFKKGRKP